MKGTIIKGYSGFYYVVKDGHVYECSLRGKNRKKNVKFVPGDAVTFEIVDEKTGVIESVLPRKNELIRPTISNVDQVIIVISMRNPEPDFWLADRLTILAQWNGIEPVLCFNKGDLVEQSEQQKALDYYQPAGFRRMICSVQSNSGIDQIRNVLANKISVFAGNSGVGKTSLMNELSDQWVLATGNVSDKSKRGKHTTRHVELFPLDENTLVADTPGFSTLQLPEDLKRAELGKLFPEFLPYLDQCKFTTCLHDSEPDCAVKKALETGDIPEGRYKNYLDFLQEVIQQERSY